MRVVCKKSWRSIALLLSGMVCASQLIAQTNPTPHNLKNGDYVFTNFANNPVQTTYPPSMQGWAGLVPNTTPTASTTVQATGDEPLCVGCADNVSTINNDGINGISLQNQTTATATGSALALALSLNTTDCYGIQLAWLSVFVAEANDLNVGGIQLQYRLGASGDWTNITGQNKVWSAATYATDHTDMLAALPAACENQPVVQLRWVMYHINNFTFGNRFYISKIHVMPDSIAGQTGYQRSGGNCDSTGALPWFNGYAPTYIKEFTTFSGAVTPFSFASNMSGLVNGYSDYTGKGPILTLATGDAFDLDLISGGGYIYDVHNAGFYVDWNQDQDFSDEDEFFPAQSVQRFTDHVGTITVPATAKSGLTRLRAKMVRADIPLSPYGPAPDGETEDYLILVDNLAAPLVDCVDKTTYTPKTFSTACMNTDSLRWGAVAGAEGYYVSIVDSVTRAVIVNKANTTTAAFSLAGILNLNKTYKVIAEAYDANGTAVSCDSSSFKTAANPDPTTDILPAYQNQVCQRTSLQLDGDPQDGTNPLTHQWTGADVTPLSATNISAPVFNAGNKAPGNYGYKYTVTDKNGCKGSDSVYVEILEGAVGGDLADLGSHSYCEGEEITLQLKGSKGTIRLESSSSASGPWSLATATVVNDTTYKVTPTATTYYRAFVTLGTCSEYSNTQTVTVKPNPLKPDVTPTSASICSGQTTTLTVTNYSTPTDITWDDAATTNSTSLTTGTAGTYKAHATANGCTSYSDPVVVTVNQNPATPTITLIGTNPRCDGDSVTLKSSSTTGNSWNTSETTQQIIVKTSGDYTVIVTNAAGCSSTSAPYTMTFNPSPAKPSISAASSGAICSGDSVVLTSSSATDNTWSTSAKTESITVKTAGNYSVTVKDPVNGCTTKSDVYTVSVNPLPAKPTITADGPLCQGTPVKLTSSYPSDNTWNDNSIQDNITISTNGDYTVTYTDANGCKSTSTPYHAVFNALPPAPTVTQTANTIRTTTTAAAYQWYDSNGPIAGATQRTYSPTKSGYYYVIVKSAAGCESPASAQFNFAGVGITTYSADAAMSIYPNPNNGTFEIALGNAASGQWTIFDITGRAVYTSEFSGKQISIHENMSNGIYMIKVKTSAGEQVQRFEVH